MGEGSDGDAMIAVAGAAKRFTLHNQGGAVIEALAGVDLTVLRGECVALTGPSGAGKSTLMRMIYGNYLTEAGSVRVRGPDGWVDVAQAGPHAILALRRGTLGYVSQFLRVVPRVPTLEVVAEPLLAVGATRATALEQARAMLTRLRVREALWSLSPTTFSGGEQQRVNIARGFAHPFPVLLVDEPTASLDPANRETALRMIEEARDRGAAILGIFHDAEARARLCTREVTLAGPGAGAAA
jgi:alpha-D-ribose 1-methylphosphonate 5-triphosphate synthase subunit PhnL